MKRLIGRHDLNRAKNVLLKKEKNIQKSRIEWLRSPTTGEAGFSINPVKGLCPVDCKDNQGKSYCYARRMYKRFKWNPKIRFDPFVMYQEGDYLMNVPPSRIFIGSTIELFGEWVKGIWLRQIFLWVNQFPQHTFIFLTKHPEHLPKEFPENCWVGTSVTGNDIESRANWMHDTDFKAKVKFASFEPLLTRPQPSYLKRYMYLFDWVIIGAQTPYSIKTAPRIEWVGEIVGAADKAGTPVFLKNNLLELVNYKSPETAFAFNKEGYYRQEFPLVTTG